MPLQKKAKPKIKGGRKGGERVVKFLCPDHRDPMKFDGVAGMWMCPQPGCRKAREPENGGQQSLMRIRSIPTLIGQQDEDGDWLWYLVYREEGLIIEFPFQMAKGNPRDTTRANEVPTQSVTLFFDEYGLIDKNGNNIT